MPADADLQCEYFLSTQLNNGSSSSSASKLNAVQQHQHSQLKGAAAPTTTTTSINGASTTTSFKFETIDFVKYTKNAMSESLKLKYELLAGAGNRNASIKLEQQQQQQQHSTVDVHTHANGLSKPTPTVTNGVAKTQQNQTVLSTTPTKPSNGVSNGVSISNACIATATSAAAMVTVQSQASSTFTTKSTTVTLDLTWSRIRTRGIGLVNMGNNCYLNATLQCLAYTAPLSQWLVTRPHSPACRFRMLKGFCSLCEVERIIFDIFNSSSSGGFSCAKPTNLCFNIKKISNLFGVGTQEDASEFFTTLLESMAKAIKFSTTTSPQSQQQQQSQNGARNNHKRSHTILDDIFAFQFRSRITCSSCGRLSDTIEDTNIWPLEVKCIQDIRKGMLHFLKEEILDGENAYKCEKCGRKTRATKKYSIRSAPNILVIHLKRFDSNHHHNHHYHGGFGGFGGGGGGGGGGKLTHYVAYPETFQLPDLISSNGTAADTAVHYRLYGVLVHLGYTSHSGHYYAYVRGPPHGQQWYKCDDQSVSAVSAHDAMAQNAYILFYARVVDSTATATKPCVNQQHQSPQQQQQPYRPTVSVMTNGGNDNHKSVLTPPPPLMQPRQIVFNGTSINGKQTYSNGASTNGSCTSSYFNSILVAKRPSQNGNVIVPRIIKADDSGPSPAKIPRLEYGPQLPPSLNSPIKTSTNGDASRVVEVKQQNGTLPTQLSNNSPLKSVSNGVTTAGQSTPTKRPLVCEYEDDISSSGSSSPKEKQPKSESTDLPQEKKKTVSEIKKLRQKRLRKLIKKLRQGRIQPNEVTVKQRKYAKTKKEKRRLRKWLKKKKKENPT